MIDRIAEVVRNAAEREGLEVWEVELAGSGRDKVLRIFIDKAEGVGHADCEAMSQRVDAVLDAEDIMSNESYRLEVSSPGVERKLLRPEHFARFTGRKARLALREPVEDQRRWDGVLAGVEEGQVVLKTGAGKSILIRMENIEKANLRFEW